MSFSSDVKEELARLIPESDCCLTAQAYGMLQLGRSFTASLVSLHTENAAVAMAYQSFVATVCGLTSSDLPLSVRSSGIHAVIVPDAAHRLHILERFGHGSSDVVIRLNRANFECDSCPSAYLRGAFLGCGTVTDPNADYHLEFSVPYYRLSRDLLALMGELGLHARAVRRKGNYIVYLKESGQIEDCLTMIGATNASLELMSIKMVKDIRNTANRIANCESANIDKTVSAAMVQIQAIRDIEQQQGLDGLPLELRELAVLRMDNPDMSLRELGEMLDPSISRSGVNHRLRRLMEIADDLKAHRIKT